MPSDTPRDKHGGARPGAGRKLKPRVVRYEFPVEDAQKRCADRLSRTLKILERLADGDADDCVEEWAAAGTITIGKGHEERPAFPHLPPDQLVLLKRKTNRARPDVRAGIYLADRALGRPGSNDAAKIEEIVCAELQLFLEKIKLAFAPEVAEAIFRSLAEPDSATPRRLLALAPDSPVERDESHSLVAPSQCDPPIRSR